MQSLSSDFQECDRVYFIIPVPLSATRFGIAMPYFGCPTPGSNTNGCVSVKGEGLPP